MIAIIDYGAGNTYSVLRAFEHMGYDATVTGDHDTIRGADRLVLPGVGSFESSVESLKNKRLYELIQDQVLSKKKKFFGICLGMQMLATIGTEPRVCDGLDLIKGEVIHFDQSIGIKVPHVGWNDVTFLRDHELLKGIEKDTAFYFVHSYYFKAYSESDVVGTCKHGNQFAAIIAKDNIFATQFHPEKSQKIGLQLLENFAEW